ncbi:MAG: cytochrome c oxidase accessory protein CcoG [Alphaproteobacteria bacterium]|nr:MAG: cytochrome c oxidase accessory protein CcoG [Alphaproteobacteria bacterium]
MNVIEQQNTAQFEVEAINRRDRQTPLYAARQKIHPKRAEGTFRRLKWLVMFVTLGIYYAAPWLRWDRGPYAPDQAILVDLYHRRFYFFFIEIWPQEFYYVAGLLVMAGVGLFLVTSSVGRAWCGYTCPQTVWVDLFLWVERFVEGDRNARIKLDAAPWSAAKVARRTVKHATWLAISVATGGAWIFYFADAPTLARDVVSGTAPGIAYMTIAVLTSTTYVLGGFMREQVCIYMCPWPRIQAAMLDENSLTVTYNDWRGEPRSRHAKKMAAEGRPIGDCVDCNACVVVCPMGIDIRDGQQLECITCALCIDACDGIMDKLGRERGLISYATLADYNRNMAIAAPAGTIDPTIARDGEGRLNSSFRKTTWRSILRYRTGLYFAVWALIGLVMLYALMHRSRLDINVLRDRNPVFVQLSDGSIRNGFTVKILNMMPEPRTIGISLDGLPAAQMTLADSSQGPSNLLFFEAEPDKLKVVKVFVRADPDILGNGSHDFSFVAQDMTGSETARYAAKFETGRNQ